jgi:hypothetical protein
VWDVSAKERGVKNSASIIVALIVHLLAIGMIDAGQEICGGHADAIEGDEQQGN